MFNDNFNRIIGAMLTIEPFKTRASQINFYSVFNTKDLGCHFLEEPPSTAMDCNNKEVENQVNNAVVPYDKIYVIVNNPRHGGTAQLGGVFARGTNWAGDYENTFVHEEGHSIAKLMDEYTAKSGSGNLALFNGEPNCYRGRPPKAAWTGLVALNDYTLGCYYSEWYRSYPDSMMINHALYFNTVSQIEINNWLDFYAEPFIDFVLPSSKITSPSDGARVSGTVNITTQLSDNNGVARAEFWKDTGFYHTEYIQPFTFSWNTLTEFNGPHLIQIKAYDVAGNRSLAQIVVVVDNGVPPVPTPTIGPLPLNCQQAGCGNIASGGSCFCDATCVGLGDCCSDACAVCGHCIIVPPPEPPPSSCSDYSSCGSCVSGAPHNCGWTENPAVNGSFCESGTDSCPAITNWYWFDCITNQCTLPTPTSGPTSTPGGPTPTPTPTIGPLPLNCAQAGCGNFADGGSCWCDAACVGSGDCCSDACAVCGHCAVVGTPTPAPPTSTPGGPTATLTPTGAPTPTLALPPTSTPMPTPTPILAFWGEAECVVDGIATIACIPAVIKLVIQSLLLFAGIVAIFLIIQSGSKFVLSSGDPKKVEEARNGLVYAILGLVIVLAAFLIVNLVSHVTGVKCLRLIGFIC